MFFPQSFVLKSSFIAFSLRKIFLNLFQRYFEFLKGASNASWTFGIILSSSKDPLLISNYSTEMRTLLKTNKRLLWTCSQKIWVLVPVLTFTSLPVLICELEIIMLCREVMVIITNCVHESSVHDIGRLIWSCYVE